MLNLGCLPSFSMWPLSCNRRLDIPAASQLGYKGEHSRRTSPKRQVLIKPLLTALLLITWPSPEAMGRDSIGRMLRGRAHWGTSVQTILACHVAGSWAQAEKWMRVLLVVEFPE